MKKSKKPFIIGLTGSIGMGKTTVAKMFKKFGIPVSNADVDVAKSMEAGGLCVSDVAKLVPSALRYDEAEEPYIDRTELGRVVFEGGITDISNNLDRLEKILHPIASSARNNFIQEMTKNGHAIIVCDIPLLFENQLAEQMDLTICVSAPQNIQKKRVLARGGMTEEKFNIFIRRQMPDSEKRRLADIVIDTSASLENTELAVKKVLDNIL